jgi:hypothetical protein
LTFVVLAGCGSDTDVADMKGADIGVSDPDLAVCEPAIKAPPSAATPCGPLTCAPGQICVEHQPGMAIPPPDFATTQDAGAGGYDPYEHSCADLPPACQLCGGCGYGIATGAARDFGCFSTICRTSEETGCSFDGATVRCIGL